MNRSTILDYSNSPKADPAAHRRKILWLLAAANVLLLVAFAWRMVPDTTAYGQAGHRAGDYIMIPANMSGVNNGVVFVLDTASGTLARPSMTTTPRASSRPCSPWT